MKETVINIDLSFGSSPGSGWWIRFGLQTLIYDEAKFLDCCQIPTDSVDPISVQT